METEREKLPVDPTEPQLATCCTSTIASHVKYNPMMVCAGCRRLIKCFLDKDAFRNYVKFCESRGRNIELGTYDRHYVVIFKGYEPYK